MEAIKKDESLYYTERLKSWRISTQGLTRFTILDSFKINNSPESYAIHCDPVYNKSHYWGQVGNCAKDHIRQRNDIKNWHIGLLLN